MLFLFMTDANIISRRSLELRAFCSSVGLKMIPHERWTDENTVWVPQYNMQTAFFSSAQTSK